ncbi:MAG: CocE/NonD family hydrolase, partial [Aquihabitans sp.]
MRRIVVALCLMLATIPATGLAGLVPTASAAPSISASGSVNQVYVTDLTPGSSVELLNGSSGVAATGTADTAGAYLFRSVAAAPGYQVRSGGTTVGPLTVTSPADHPTDSWYAVKAASEPIAAGFGYLTTRDGTKLSVNVTLPFEGGAGPWPVVINYSGYDPSQPGLPPRESLLYAAQGYVVVGVNMRGTGCSGGAFEFMETLQGLDGYDMVETIAHQSWSNGNVGLVGISYSGYSQLYVAATRPPHLRAITPLSPYSDTYSAILYPGGILNNGFAVDWATDRQAGAKPRARGWVKKRINEGDTVCDRNQTLRLQSKPLLERIQETPFADHEFDYLNTETFVDQIQVPTYLASQWQDEQTGGSAANLVPLFNPATKVYGSF